MPNPTANLALPNISAAQAQKHVTHNEALRLLDGIVQLGVISRTLTAPPGSPVDGDRYIVASGATCLWSGWDLNVAFWTDGAWMRLVPRIGWTAWVAADAALYVWTGAAWVLASGGGASFSDAAFEVFDDVDATKKLRFQLSGIGTGITRTLQVPDLNGTLALISNATQTFAGQTGFSNPVVNVGTSTATATYALGGGATLSGNTKTVNIATGGVTGSTSVINIGSAGGGGGQTIINTPTVTFANSVTAIGANAANLSVLWAGIGGATADATNRLSMNTPAVLLNNAGASIRTTLNKAAAGDDAALAWQTGFSTRALEGLLGSDDWQIKVSPDGSTWFNAMIADRNTGRVRFPVGLALDGMAADPAAPQDGWLWFNAAAGQLRTRLGGVTRAVVDQDIPWLTPNAGEFIMTTTGAGGNSAGTLAGVADRCDLYPFSPRGDVAVDRIGINVTTAVAAALARVVIYTGDANGRPDQLLLESSDMDCATTGAKTATVGLTLRRGSSYWLGIRHSATATLSSWPPTATPDINGGAITPNARKVLRRTLAFATPAPASWGFTSSELAGANPTAIWLRVA